jgi:hypothetical protein
MKLDPAGIRAVLFFWAIIASPMILIALSVFFPVVGTVVLTLSLVSLFMFLSWSVYNAVSR